MIGAERRENVRDGAIGGNSTNCLVKRPGGQPGTSNSSATLVKSRSLNTNQSHGSFEVLAQIVAGVEGVIDVPGVTGTVPAFCVIWLPLLPKLP